VLERYRAWLLAVRDSDPLPSDPVGKVVNYTLNHLLTVLKNRVQTVQPARDARRCNPPATPSGTTRPVRPPVTTAPGAHW
jgi:hypothetical protein